MNRIARVLGPALCVMGLVACGASTQRSVANAPPGVQQQCKPGGEHCRWDAQCCSGRCYVDTGCSG
jgi:hypothetical protein